MSSSLSICNTFKIGLIPFQLETFKSDKTQVQGYIIVAKTERNLLYMATLVLIASIASYRFSSPMPPSLFNPFPALIAITSGLVLYQAVELKNIMRAFRNAVNCPDLL